MGFLQSIQKSLQASFAEQERAALVQLLRQRAPSMTFAELREVLASPLGRGLAGIRVGEVFAGDGPVAPGPTREKTAVKRSPARTQAAAEKSSAGAAKGERKAGKKAKAGKQAPGKQAPAEQAAKQAGKKPAKQGQKPGKKATASKPAAAATTAKQAGTKPGKKATASKPGAAATTAKSGRRSPPGVSPEKRAEIDRYDAAILAAIREAGDWVAAGDVRTRVGGTAETLRLAFKRLTERRAIVREGERAQTRYKVAG